MHTLNWSVLSGVLLRYLRLWLKELAVVANGQSRPQTEMLELF